MSEWARLRTGPSTSSSEITKIPAGSAITFYPQSETVADGEVWLKVGSGELCGWMAGTYIGTTGDNMDGIDAVAYIDRILRGGDDRSMHATTEMEGNYLPVGPFDGTVLQPGIQSSSDWRWNRGRSAPSPTGRTKTVRQGPVASRGTSATARS
ncbi:MAG: SH3 domain-containing protein [Acidimicrobiales bacterium]